MARLKREYGQVYIQIRVMRGTSERAHDSHKHTSERRAQHQENPESTSTNLEALGKYKIVWSPTVSFEVLGSASVIDSQCEVLGV